MEPRLHKSQVFPIFVDHVSRPLNLNTLKAVRENNDNFFIFPKIDEISKILT